MPQSPVPFHPLIYSSNSGAGLTAHNCIINLRSSLIALCSTILPSLPIVWMCTLHKRSYLISCWRDKEKIALMCTSYISYENYLIALGNNFMLFIMKVREGTTQILDSIYKLLRSSEFGSV